jgi:single-stranded DNA-binding protein
MSYNYNHLTLVGHVCSEVESTKVGECTKANFKMNFYRPCNSETGERKRDTFTIILFGRLGEAAEMHIKKGDPVLIDGSIQTKEVEHFPCEQVKFKRIEYITEIIAETFQILGEYTQQKEGG